MSMDTAFMADQFSEPLDVPLVLHLHVHVEQKICVMLYSDSQNTRFCVVHSRCCGEKLLTDREVASVA